MKKLIQELKQRWAKYFLEVIAITLGILGAFYLENWNQERQDNRIRHDYLKRLQADLSSDRNDLQEQLDLLDNRVRSVNELMPNFNNIEAPRDTLLNLIYSLFYSEDFIENDNTFQDLVSSGHLELLAQNILKQRLHELYSLYKDLNSHEDHIKEDNRLYIYNPAMYNFDHGKMTSSINSDESGIILEKFLSNVTIKNGHAVYLSNSELLREYYFSALSNLEELDSIIVAQIKKY